MSRRFLPPFRARRRDLADFGLRVVTCSQCGQMHPLDAPTPERPGGEPAPETCSNCGKPLAKNDR